MKTSSFLHRSVQQSASRAASLLLTAIAFAFVARMLSVEEFAAYAAALALYMIASAVAEFGLQNTLVMEFDQRPESEARIFSTGVLASAGLGAAAAVAAAPVVVALFGPLDRLAAALLLPAFLVSRLVAPCAARRQHRLELGRLAVADVGGRALTAAVLGAALLLDLPADAVVRLGLIGVATLLGSLLNVVLLARGIGRVSWPGASGWRDARRLVRRAIPLGFTNAASLVHVRVDQIIIAAFGLVSGLASYAIAYRVVEAGLGLVGGVAVVTFPLLARARADRAKIARQTESLLLVVGVVATVLVYGLAPVLVTILGGPGQDEAVSLLRLLSPVVLVSIVNLGAAQVSIVQRRGRTLMLLAVSFAIGNVLLNVALIPILGVHGSAVATVVSESVGAVAVALLAHRALAGSVKASAWAAAGVGTFVATWVAHQIGGAYGPVAFVVTVAIGVLITCVCMRSDLLALARSATVSPPSSGQREHLIERDPGPLRRVGVDGDAVDDLACEEVVEHPGQVGGVDAEHRRARAHQRVE
jgi:O-antigen/teichoic acid export membrane protein